MLKEPIGIDVLAAARERVAWTFDNFERIYLSFSAGKDSTVMLHIVADEARKRGVKFGLLLIDLEAQYKLTMEHALACVGMYEDCTEVFWCCLPIHLRNAVSVFSPFWMCWDPDAKNAWVRPLPSNCISDISALPFFRTGMEFEEFVPEFGKWYAQNQRCACLVGIRTDESLNRFRTIVQSKKETLQGKRWTSKILDTVYNVYPIYDWRSSDIWVYHVKNPDRPYNKLYDLMHKAGVPLGYMRICQPYGDDQRRGLWLFHLIEPETWARVVARVNGANGGSMYMQDSGNMSGYRSISKPVGHTWQTFAELLVSSMPSKTREHYRNKIVLFQRWWLVRGYPEGIPDEADYHMEAARRAPSWRRICKSLLRNDWWCKGLGYTQQRSTAYMKYLDLMKRRHSNWGTHPDLLDASLNTSVLH